MAIIQRIFNGKLNLDDSPFSVPPNDYIGAMNITRDAQGLGQDMVVSNIVGNQLVNYTLPDGTNKQIGHKEDKVRNRIYYFIWNSNKYHLMLYYDATTDTIIKLIKNLTDTNNIDVLAFDPSYKINHIDIFYDDVLGDQIAWTDGNVSPRKINFDKIKNGDYSSVQVQFIEAAKRPPLSPPICLYGSDSTRNSNSLIRTMFQFCYWWVYDNYEESTLSTYSKIPLPIGFYGSDNNTDQTKNNFITVNIDTGDENVIGIKIAMRNNIGAVWSDFVIVKYIDKQILGIANNITYSYYFYNDSVYPTIDPTFAALLFDWLPQKAFTQCAPNGNVLNYDAITEGYNNYPVSSLDVTITAANETNIPPDNTRPSLTYTTNGTEWIFSINGTITTGTLFKVLANIPGTGVTTFITYTSVGGDTPNSVAVAITAYILANWPSYYDGTASFNHFYVLPPTPGFYVTEIQVDIPGGIGISTEKTWLWNCNYLFGIVYVDEQNRDMPGVTTYVNPVNSDNDFIVTTPNFSQDSGISQTPVITATINHLPPIGAVKFYWTRQRLQYGSFIFYETCDYQDPSDGYLYFCLANIDQYYADNNQFIYNTVTVSSQSRIKILAGVTSGAYNSNVWAQDYLIVGTVTRALTGSSPAIDKTFIKVVKPAGSISPAYTVNMLVMVYTTSPNPSTNADSVYFEWGEAYDIYIAYVVAYIGLTGTFDVAETITGAISGATATIVTDNGSNSMVIKDITGTFQVGETITGGKSGAIATFSSIDNGTKYHAGKDRDQTGGQSAEYIWQEGDVYYHSRVMYNNLVTSPNPADTLNIMDSNFSDFFLSGVNDNGRGQAIEVNANKTFYGTLTRFSQEFQQGTIINGLNRFYFDNSDEYDLSFGSTQKTFIEGRYKYVLQQFDIGVVPILIQIVKDVSGDPLQANSDILLNKITYPYVGKNGIGTVPESFGFSKFAKYYVDSNKGTVNRLSLDGNTILSILYKTNAFFVAKLSAFQKQLNNGYPPLGGVYTGDPTVYGHFDQYTNKYIVALEEINRYDVSGNLIFHQDPYTFSFLETRDATEGFETQTSFYPEGMVALNNLFVSFTEGQFWKHTSNTYANFFGVQGDVYIDGVFNDVQLIKKTWQALSEISGDVWWCPLIYTNVNTYEIPSPQRQESNLVSETFKKKEQNWYASFKRDIHSKKGIINGDILKGNYMVVRFQAINPSEFSYLSQVYIKYVNSYLVNV